MPRSSDSSELKEIHKLELKISELEAMLKQSITNQKFLMEKVDSLLGEVSNHRVLENRVSYLETRSSNMAKIGYSILTALALFAVSQIFNIKVG